MDSSSQTFKARVVNRRLETPQNYSNNTDLTEDVFHHLKKIGNEHPRNIIVSYININSIKNKFESFSSLIKENVDVLAIAETKLDDSFPTTQFEIQGFKKPYRLDISSNAGGLLVYVKDHLISRELKGLELPYDIQILSIEINLRKTKWLLFSSCRPPIATNNIF